MVTYSNKLHQQIIDYLGADVPHTGVIDVLYGFIYGVALTGVQGFMPGRKANNLGVMSIAGKEQYFYIYEGSTISLSLDSAIICALARLNRELGRRVHRHEYPGEESVFGNMEYMKVKYYVYPEEGGFIDEQLGHLKDGEQLLGAIVAPLTTRTLESDIGDRVGRVVDGMIQGAGIANTVKRLIGRGDREQ